MAAAGFVFRFLVALWPAPALSKGKGVPHAVKTSVSKHGRITSMSVGVPLARGVSFALTREGKWDRWFKRLGFSEEFQTGSPEFDDRIYVACDAPSFREALQDRERARLAVLFMIDKLHVTRVHSDGRMLWCVATPAGDDPVAADLLKPLEALRVELDPLLTGTPGLFGDPVARRALLAQAVAWSLAGYAAVGVLEFAAHGEDYHADPGKLLLLGLEVAAVTGALLLAGVAFLLGRSSRSHRVLVESALVILLSVPAFGIQVVSDFNRSGAQGPSVVQEVVVQQAWRETHRGKHGVSYSYHFSPADGRAGLPKSIEVTREVHATLANGRKVRIELAPGRLGIRWYRSINGIPVGNRPPG